ncbi:hypothetical protein, partial [Phaeobacter sp. S60]|uniref:hypothetical protein n=1 Tax=Phaeobacter sp. S60 TaxID=1569353 RepID=UPI0015850A9D
MLSPCPLSVQHNPPADASAIPAPEHLANDGLRDAVVVEKIRPALAAQEGKRGDGAAAEWVTPEELLHREAAIFGKLRCDPANL